MWPARPQNPKTPKPLFMHIIIHKNIIKMSTIPQKLFTQIWHDFSKFKNKSDLGIALFYFTISLCLFGLQNFILGLRDDWLYKIGIFFVFMLTYFFSTIIADLQQSETRDLHIIISILFEICYFCGCKINGLEFYCFIFVAYQKYKEKYYNSADVINYYEIIKNVEDFGILLYLFVRKSIYGNMPTWFITMPLNLNENTKEILTILIIYAILTNFKIKIIPIISVFIIGNFIDNYQNLDEIVSVFIFYILVLKFAIKYYTEQIISLLTCEYFGFCVTFWLFDIYDSSIILQLFYIIEIVVISVLLYLVFRPDKIPNLSDCSIYTKISKLILVLQIIITCFGFANIFFDEYEKMIMKFNKIIKINLIQLIIITGIFYYAKYNVKNTKQNIVKNIKKSKGISIEVIISEIYQFVF